MIANAVQVANLSKSYIIHEREAGIVAAIKGFFNRRTREIAAVDNISLTIKPGEVIGLLGPNGAGKTSTLKMLAGLLHPTAGNISVLGFKPAQRDKDFLKQIALVMGNRNQLLWDIPASDSFELNRAIYRIPANEYQTMLDQLIELLEIGDLMRKPVRNLSLGERMKCEIAAALLHRPRVLFLDEPTIGLDVVMQRRIRNFLKTYNQKYEATILLTSHYMADIEALCPRVVVIHQGKLLFDGQLSSLTHQFAPHKIITLKLDTLTLDLGAYGEVIDQSPGQIQIRVPQAEAAQIAGQLLTRFPITDLTIQDTPIDEVIEQVFSQSTVMTEPTPLHD